MKSNLLGMIAVVLMACSGIAGAVPTLVGSQTDPTGINGLVIDGVAYDVWFNTASFDTTFTTPSVFGPLLSQAGIDAAAALAGAFNSFGVTGLGGFSCTNLQIQCIVYADIDFSHSVADAAGLIPPGTSWFSSRALGGGAPSLECSASFCAEAAHFSVVPEPSALALLSLGLTGLAFTRRRKQAH